VLVSDAARSTLVAEERSHISHHCSSGKCGIEIDFTIAKNSDVVVMVESGVLSSSTKLMVTCEAVPQSLPQLK
jgi:hypothetical protein